MFAPAHSADSFIGATLNILGWHINGYPFSFVIWNILLATLAVLLTRYTVALWQSGKPLYLKLALSALWLAFLPNTAYLMTDARHIIGYCPTGAYGNVCPENSWMTLFFFSYGAIGWPAFVLALRPMKELVVKHFGLVRGQVFASFIILVSALGLLLGLLDRFNVWDIVVRPISIIIAAGKYFSSEILFFNLLMSAVILTILYAIGEKIFIKARKE
jgi:uncharacterized membrane protein